MGKPKEWKLSESMMHQKWGSVLRTLQPNAIEANVGKAAGMTPRLGGIDLAPRPRFVR